jgi:hypothetical protein
MILTETTEVLGSPRRARWTKPKRAAIVRSFFAVQVAYSWNQPTAINVKRLQIPPVAIEQ